MKEIRLKQARLNHFLNLINADLSKMSDGDKYSLAARFRFSTVQTGDDYWKATIEILPEAQRLFKYKIEEFLKLKEKEIASLPPLERVIELRGGCFRILPASPSQIIIQRTDRVGEQLDYDIGELGQLFDGVSKTAFRKCRNCKKMFLQLSKKEKLYCSSSCAFKFLSKQRRNHLKKQR